MMQRNSQVTVFIIIGLLLLFALGMVLFLRNQVNEITLQKNLEAVGDLFRQHGKYHRYVDSCMKHATEEGLFLIGQQGGVIYDYQSTGGKKYLGPTNGFVYGKYVLPNKFNDIYYNMSYGITMSQLGSTYHPDVPFYPYGLTKLINNPKTINPMYHNMFGNYPRNPFAPLCDYYGENKRGQSEAVACETYDSNNNLDLNSVQEYLEAYIENRTLKCIKLERLPELEENKIQMGNITANVTFGEEHVFVNIELPMRIEIGNVKTVVKLREFHVKYNIRLKKIHELVSHLIDKDVNNIFFNMVRHARTLNDCRDITGGNSLCLKPGMKVSKISNVCLGTELCEEGNYDDVLVITDEESRMSGRPYTFKIAIENRPPALNLIRREVGTGSYHYDFVVFVGETIEITPAGVDPDEDQHDNKGEMNQFYKYFAWKESYDDYFDCPAGDCALSDETRIRHIDVAVRNWTRSAPYQATRRNASYKTNTLDLGVHTLEVKVCDEGDLCDSQAVRIIVVNGSFAGGQNEYEDILPGYASLEDPYTLISPITGDLLGIVSPNYALYNWSIFDSIGNLIWSVETNDPNVTIGTYDIENIDMSDFFNNPTNHSFTVDIYRVMPSGLRDLSSRGSTNTIQVKDCLPHRSFSASYPYNVTDPFMSNHTCCDGNPWDASTPGWGDIFGVDQVCYSLIEYGCRDDSSFTNIGSVPIVYNDINPSPERDNDLYLRVFSRKCDGTRGNACLGAFEEERTAIDVCGECETCRYGMQGCGWEEQGAFICNTTHLCTAGQGSTHTQGTGPWDCQSTCFQGICNISYNCQCETSCGAGCESEDSYIWDDQSCTYNCNDFISGSPSSDCQYHSGPDSTVCSAPRTSGSCTPMDIGGTTYQVCRPAGARIESEDNYASYCRYNNYCYYGVSCNGDGVHEIIGEQCLSAGVSDGDICYYHSTGSTDCDRNGACTYEMDWSDIGVSCQEGSPDSGACRVGNTCYSIDCHDRRGWEYDMDYCSYGNDCVAGFVLDNDDCIYDIECTNSGWDYNNANCPRSQLSGDTCYYTRSCDTAGCVYANGPFCPAPGTDDGTGCVTDRDCSISGCDITYDSDPRPSCAAGETYSCNPSGWSMCA